MLVLLCLVSATALGNDVAPDEAPPSFLELASLLAFGGGIALVGFLVERAKFLQNVGKVIKGIGVLLGALAVICLACILLDWALATAITLALYVGSLTLAGYLLYVAYHWLFSAKR
ncbi:hypothetical protein [Nibribacter koreensis]|uniref:hypothetical protein n=1 Tax=Nibribacter koreensis TaxID=1084519 RepID=UPI0031F0E44C